MKIIPDFPPNVADIEALVPGLRETKGLIFAHGGAVYNPSGTHLPEWILAHEQVHLDRQGDLSSSWWKRYLADPEFRFAEELPAHRVEWKVFCRHEKRREARARYLNFMAQRLAGPLYGRLVTMAAARAKIAGSAVDVVRLLPQVGKG